MIHFLVWTFSGLSQTTTCSSCRGICSNIWTSSLTCKCAWNQNSSCVSSRGTYYCMQYYCSWGGNFSWVGRMSSSFGVSCASCRNVGATRRQKDAVDHLITQRECSQLFPEFLSGKEAHMKSYNDYKINDFGISFSSSAQFNFCLLCFCMRLCQLANLGTNFFFQSCCSDLRGHFTGIFPVGKCFQKSLQQMIQIEYCKIWPGVVGHPGPF